jgi:hypothetical protein
MKLYCRVCPCQVHGLSSYDSEWYLWIGDDEAVTSQMNKCGTQIRFQAVFKKSTINYTQLTVVYLNIGNNSVHSK